METQLFYPHLEWNSTKKFLLRFAIIFLGPLMILIPSFIGEEFYPWVGSAILHLEKPITIFPGGSGDTTYNYVELLTNFVLSLLAASIWSIFNKKEKNYDTLMHYFLVFCRYYVAFSMFNYGYAKIFYNQFGSPSLWKLVQPYGESSPMGIAWTFIGASKPYTMVSGVMEVIAGILLLFRRTSFLGALTAFIVMFNVMLMNYCYDIPVKIYSTQLVLLAFIIMYFNGHNLRLILFKNSATAPEAYKPLFTKKWLKISRIIIKSVVVVGLIGVDAYIQSDSIATNGPDAPKTPLYGIHKPTQLIKNGDTLRTYSDSAEWKFLVIEWEGMASIRQLNDRSYRLIFNVDTIKKMVTTNLQSDTTHSYELAYKQLNDTTLNLKGIFMKDTIDYTFGKVNMKSFRLTNRGFHWVNEYPFNK